MRPRPRMLALKRLAVCAVVSHLAVAAHAGTIVLANRTAEPVALVIVHADKTSQQLQLEPDDVVSIAAGAGASVRFRQGAGIAEYAMQTDAAYFFHARGEGAERRVELEQIGLAGAEDKPSVARQTEPPEAAAVKNLAAPLKIKVKLLVDDDERAAERAWRQRLLKRLAEASRILERQARVTFEAVAFGAWDSDDENHDFPTALREFEVEAQAQPARLAIGFTSQYALVQGRTNLGGTRGALRSHILLREWSQHFSEPERLELLVHELGHFLAASHSPESSSVMRPILGDRQAVAQRFRISFDPLNALAMSLTGEGLRGADIQQLHQLPAPTRRRLGEIYLTLSRSLPEDPAARHYLHWVAGGSLPPLPGAGLHRGEATQEPPPGEATDESSPQVQGARRVLRAIVEAARRNAALPPGGAGAVGPARLVGDALTDRYVRAAAEETLRFRDSVSNKSMLVALAVALDTSDLLRSNPLTANLWRQVESDAERSDRLVVIGLPTMHDRSDLTQHFFVSAALAALAGPTAAESAGLAKELRDMQGASGFSFSDLCADLAGIALAARLEQDERQVSRLLGFRVSDGLPTVDDLPDGLSAEQFAKQFGSVLDARFQRQVEQLRQRVAATLEQQQQR